MHREPGPDVNDDRPQVMMLLSPAEGMSALDRILASEAFAKAPGSRGFLTYVVTETVHGRGDALSERTVARRAMGRGADFDGRYDSSVRVRATRVREALERYYDGEGSADAVRIRLAPGAYAVTFLRAAASILEVNAGPPSVLVRRFTPEGPGADQLVGVVSESLARCLAGMGTVPVVGPVSDNVSSRGRYGDASTVLDGAVTVAGASTRISAWAASGADGSVLWTDSRTIGSKDPLVLDTVEAWARQVAARLADHTGFLLRRWVLSEPNPVDVLVRGQLAFYRYLHTSTPESVEVAAAALDEALAAGPRTPTVLAMRGAVGNARVLLGTTSSPSGELAQVESLAREALSMDATFIHAHLVLGGVAWSRQEWSLVLAHARTAEQLDPHSPALLFGVGILFAAAGHWSHALDVFRQAAQCDPDMPSNTQVWFAIGYALVGDYAQSLAASSLLADDLGTVGAWCRAMALSGLGYDERARDEMSSVLASDPNFYVGLHDWLTGTLKLSETDALRIEQLLRDADPRQS